MQLAPSAKTNTTVFSGAIVTVAAWAVNGLIGVEVPGEVWAAITTIVMGLIAYLVPAKSGKYIDLDAAEGYEPVYAVESDDEDDILEDKEEVENVAH